MEDVPISTADPPKLYIRLELIKLAALIFVCFSLIWFTSCSSLSEGFVVIWTGLYWNLNIRYFVKKENVMIKPHCS